MRRQQDAKRRPEVKRGWEEDNQLYGVRKVWLQLNREGFEVARCTPLVHLNMHCRAVIGRKNFMFAGSDAGGETLADTMTIIETAKFNDLNPEAYLTDVCARAQDHKINQIDELLPWSWKFNSHQAAAAA